MRDNEMNRGTPIEQKRATEVAQLDVLRGLAIVLMVVNHVGVKLADPHLQGLSPITVAEFLGSFAPVIFYFTTGFGIGVARQVVTWRVFRITLTKSLLLLVADQFMWWDVGRSWGLDFLAFIGIISVILTGIAASRKPVRLAGLLLVAVVVLRFGLGPLLRHRVAMSGFDAWLIGTMSTSNVSYPLSPWLAFPLLGFLLARRFRRISTTGTLSFNWAWMSAGVVIAMSGAAVLFGAGATFFRWGTMSIAYFVLSLAVILLCVMASWAITARFGRLARAVSLRGVTSLAVVPIHYALLGMVAATAHLPLRTVPTLATMLAVTVLAIVLSRTFASTLLDRLSADAPPVPAISTLISVAMLSAVEIQVARGSPLTLAGLLAGQLAVTALLVMGRTKRDRAPSGAAALS